MIANVRTLSTLLSINLWNGKWGLNSFPNRAQLGGSVQNGRFVTSIQYGKRMEISVRGQFFEFCFAVVVFSVRSDPRLDWESTLMTIRGRHSGRLSKGIWYEEKKAQKKNSDRNLMSSMLMYQQLYCYWWKWKANKTKTEIEGEGDERDTSYDCVTRKKSLRSATLDPVRPFRCEITAAVVCSFSFWEFMKKNRLTNKRKEIMRNWKCFVIEKKKQRDEEKLLEWEGKKNVKKVESIRDSIIVISRVCVVRCYVWEETIWDFDESEKLFLLLLFSDWLIIFIFFYFKFSRREKHLRWLE